VTGTTVKDVMTAHPTSIESTASIAEAARRMAQEDVGSLPVVQEGRLVGMVTDRDLAIKALARNVDPREISVGEVCSENPVTADPNESLDDALQRMAKNQVRRLPVATDGQLVGILAQADVARTADPESTGRLVEEISE
jgi:CBS domain-containing protein